MILTKDGLTYQCNKERVKEHLHTRKSMGKELSFHQMEKTNINFYLIQYIKINSEWIIDLNVQTKRIT